MSMEIKIGRWLDRGGRLAIVNERVTDDQLYPWWGIDSVGCVSCWSDDGSWMPPGLKSIYDLVQYVGPLEKQQ